MLIDVPDVVVVQAEAEAQVPGAQYAVQVGNGGKLLGGQSAEEGVKSLNAVVLVLEVCTHEADVGCQVLKERTGKGTA